MTRPDVRQLCEQLSLREQVAQLGAVRIGALIEGGSFSPSRARTAIPHGIGRVTRVGRESSLPPRELAGVIADLQSFLQSETTHGIPAFVREEGLCGYAGRRGATVPQPINVASAWDPAIARELARFVGGQLRAVGCQVTLSPVADLGLDPRWGRIEETFGEDPVLASRLTNAVVRGLDDSDVDATLKHFVGHGRPTGGRNRGSSTASLAEMRDADCRPFRAGIDAGAPSVMAAYNTVDGVPCHANEALLSGLLREEWGFDGTVVSDGRGIDQLADEHGVVEDYQAAGVAALTAGVDVELPETECFGERVVAAVESGQVTPDRVERAVRRHLRQKVRAGLFDDPAPDPARTANAFGPDAGRDLARRSAQRSLVLLDNDGILPLVEEATVAVVGPNADAPRALLGNYSYAGAEDVDAGIEVATPLAALAERLQNVEHVRGCGVRPGETDDLPSAVEVAERADVAVTVVGGRSGIDVERDSAGTTGEALDRASLDLPGRQDELVARVADTGTPVVAVLVGGRPFAVPDVVERSAATIAAWLPGMAGGDAITDVLLGTDPGGRLPVSLPRTVGQLPVHYRQSTQSRGDYVFTSGEPLFPFGHGESYATFSYGDVSLTEATIAGDGLTTVSVAVENVAERPGSEVVQLYASDTVSSTVRPERELLAFQRLDLDAGERREIHFEVPASALAWHDAQGALTVEPGRFDILVARSATDVRGRIPLRVRDAGQPERRASVAATVE